MHQSNDMRGEFRQRETPLGPEVDHLADDDRPFAMHQAVKRAARVLDVREVTRGGAIAMNSKRFAEHATGDEARDDLLEMLTRSELIEGAYDDGGHVVGGEIRIHETIRPRLRARIRTHRHQRLLFVHLRRSGRTVYLGGGDVEEAVDVLDVLQHGVRDDLRAQYVGLEEMVIVVNRPRDVRLGGEVNDDIGLLDERVDKRRIPHIAVPELDARARAAVTTERRQVVEAAGICEQVEDEDPVIGVRVVKVVDEVAADESRTTGHENRTGVVFRSAHIRGWLPAVAAVHSTLRATLLPAP